MSHATLSLASAKMMACTGANMGAPLTTLAGMMNKEMAMANTDMSNGKMGSGKMGSAPATT